MMSSQDDCKVVGEFVDTVIKRLRRHGGMRLPYPTMPVEMRDETIVSHNDWVGWKPVPSTVTDEELNELETFIGHQFPPSYRQFLKHVHFLDLSTGGIRFTSHPIHDWKGLLLETYNSGMRERVYARGLIPFGDEVKMDAGPVCFDTRFQDPDGDCPVVFWDHEWVGTNREICLMFSSTAKMFECLLFESKSEVNFQYHDTNYDDPDLLPTKQRLLKEFLEIDPVGAGAAAREYWTCWGVQPSD